MRHIGAGILLFRILGFILLVVAGLTAFQRMGSLGAIRESGVDTGGLFIITYFMPVVFIVVAAVVLFAIAAFLKKKQ